jgi:hypothetical protein
MRSTLRARGVVCSDLAQRLVTEAVIWQQLEHANIVPFLGVVHDQNMPFSILHTITPWMPQGTLLDFIKSSSYDACTQRAQLVRDNSRYQELIRVHCSLWILPRVWTIFTRYA